MRRAVLRVGMAVVILLGLGLSGLMCARVADRGRYATAYSTYSAGPHGARGVYELAARQGRRTQRWVQDLEGLPEHGVLVALGGCLAPQRRPLSRYERERLAEWIRAGGTLMVFGAEDYLPGEYPAHLVRSSEQCRAEGLADVLGELEAAADPPVDESDEPAAQSEEPDGGERVPEDTSPSEWPRGPLSEGELEVWIPSVGEGTEPVYVARSADGPLAALGAVPMVQPAGVVVDAQAHESNAAIALARFGERPGAVAIEMGSGHLVVFGSGSMLVNENLGGHRGGVLFTRLLDAYAVPNAPVVFDEYHLGTGGTRSLVRYLRDAGVGAVLLQLLLLGGLWILRSGRRLGELEDLPEAPPGGTVSYVAATSALYSRSPDRGGIARVLLIRALDRVATAQRIRARQPDQLVEQLRSLGREQAAAACEELLQLFREPVPSEKALLHLSHRVDALTARASATHTSPSTLPDAPAVSAAEPLVSSPPPAPPTP